MPINAAPVAVDAAVYLHFAADSASDLLGSIPLPDNFTDANGDRLIYTMDDLGSSLPAGYTASLVDGELQLIKAEGYSPANAGDVVVKVYAQDGRGGWAEARYIFTPIQMAETYYIPGYSEPFTLDLMNAFTRVVTNDAMPDFSDDHLTFTASVADSGGDWLSVAPENPSKLSFNVPGGSSASTIMITAKDAAGRTIAEKYVTFVPGATLAASPNPKRIAADTRLTIKDISRRFSSGSVVPDAFYADSSGNVRAYTSADGKDLILEGGYSPSYPVETQVSVIGTDMRSQQGFLHRLPVTLTEIYTSESQVQAPDPFTDTAIEEFPDGSPVEVLDTALTNLFPFVFHDPLNPLLHFSVSDTTDSGEVTLRVKSRYKDGTAGDAAIYEIRFYKVPGILL
ncbi:hypothetical protein LJK88_38570 [Paenibacillus sp. P26]|nr:hypothetical protein LJK88_38570 [Paenibacillus sp. P26]